MSPGLFAARDAEMDCARPLEITSKPSGGWNPQGYAREQIRGLVRQVFFSNVGRPARQVVFCALEPETDVLNLCWRVGEALALETKQSIGIVGDYPQAFNDGVAFATEKCHSPTGGTSLPNTTRVASNLWLVPPLANEEGQSSTASLHSFLGAIRTRFEFSIVVGPCAAESTAATAMAQLADGIVLVLSAKRTRRITARKITERLETAQARLLGIVLSDRVFPIPERIYRRL
jgi:hypothetical protein